MYQLWQPAPPLRPYIDNYWSLRTGSADETVQEQIFVDGRADVIFNFGSPYRRNNAQGQIETIAQSNLDAQRLYPVDIQQTGSVHLIGVRFQPGGLAPFLREEMHQLSNAVLDLRDILGRAVDALAGRLYDYIDQPDAQIALLNAFFLERLTLTASQRLVLYTAQQITRQRGVVSIQQLSVDSGYSVRSLDRLFRQHMGFSPKLYARIARLQHAIHLMSSTPDPSLTTLAFACGYYDQAHFGKEFRALTGMTPGEYRLQLLGRREEPPPNLVQFLQDDAGFKG